MKSIYSAYNEADSMYIMSFGMENNSQKAHWGSGSRSQIIIHYVLKGHGYYNKKKVKEGEGFYIPAGKVHEYKSSKENPWEYFWVILNGKMADEICRKYIDVNENGIFKYNFKEELYYFADNFFKTQKNITAVKAMGVFLLLMSRHEKKEEIHSNLYVINAKKYMEQNIFRNFTICEIADILHINDRYLYNLFIQYEGISPKKYLNKLRVEKACEMLKFMECSITEVAVSTGFNDVLTFSRFFSKHMKESPTTYRMKNKI